MVDTTITNEVLSNIKAWIADRKEHGVILLHSTAIGRKFDMDADDAQKALIILSAEDGPLQETSYLECLTCGETFVQNENESFTKSHYGKPCPLCDTILDDTSTVVEFSYRIK